MYTVRDVLIFLSIKYKGDWDQIYNALKSKERVDEIEIEKTKNKVGENVITCIDEDYPIKLKEIYRPPFVLFFKGDKSLLYKKDYKYLAFIGSRECSSYGERVTKKLIDDLSLENVVIVSGLAKGIDGVAHFEALENNLKTIAVLGTGIDYCYPKENVELYNRISKDGLIISEYPFSSSINNSFPKRNRLIAGLSDGVIVCEAKGRSGTAITINYALEQGKEIFSVPCSLFENSICNELIKDGAKIVTEGKDILEEI